MIEKKFNLYLPHRVVIYLRMSQEGQNPRSPEQQEETIRDLIKKLDLPWTIVAVYRDDFISARFTRKRPNFQRMVKDLKTGVVQATLILVDTFERLTRADNGDAIREMFRRLKVLVLTANSRFADPTTSSGRALSAFEALRASEDGKVKAHNVLRGKKDAVRLKQWPGGAAPFGFLLEAVFKTENSLQVIAHRIPKPDPATKWIVEEIFRLADELGYGTSRIAKSLNNDPRISEELKPFHPATVGEILDNEMHIGDYIWGKCCTEIVDEVRIKEPIPKEEWLHITGFCEPIIDRERWDRVQALRQARREKCPKKLKAASAMAGLAASGIALKYPLSGLVFCAHCHRRMNPQSSSEYQSVSGNVRRYVHYGCTGLAGGLCNNQKRIPEEWLRATVVSLIRSRLQLDDCGPTSVRLLEFVEMVRGELESHAALQPDPTAALQAEQQVLEDQCCGWRQSLGNRELAAIVRQSIERDLERAMTRIQQIEAEQAARLAGTQQRQQVLDPQEISERLQRLATMLNEGNASAMNLMLSHHIDAIWCDDKGHVVVRTCKLGALSGDLTLFITDASQPGPASGASAAKFCAKPRRRARLDIKGAIEDDEAEIEANEFAVDNDRFAGLGPEWFAEDHFDVPETLSWAQANARAVAEFRLSTHSSMEVTAQHFGKTTPTIRAALTYARDQFDIDAFGKSISRPTLPNWSRANSQVVAEFMSRPGITMKMAVEHFGKTEPTIRKAMKFAQVEQPPRSGGENLDDNSEQRPDAA